jgi:hypothetical protein
MGENKLIYSGREIVLVTKHKKEIVIKPLLEKETGCKVLLESDFDTDKLGTFSREIKRKKTQHKTALQKIKIGLRYMKTDIGVASEGSFGIHPYLSVPWNTEIVVIYDKRNNIEISGMYESAETNHGHLLTGNLEDALQFSVEHGFPGHYVIIRPNDSNSKKIIKGINDTSLFVDAFYSAKTISRSGQVFIEMDLRAFANPTRMKSIEKATLNLLANISMVCPYCGTPGFVVVEKVKGLPCACCRTPSELTLKNIHKCQKCRHIKEEMYPQGRYAPPEYCYNCNP